MLKRCIRCGVGKLARRSVEQTRHVAGHAFTASLPALVCAACGEAYLADDVVTRFDLAVAGRLAEAGITEAAALKFMRKVTGLNGKEFAELLEVRAETVSRWEQSRRPIDRATYAVIRQLLFDRMHGSSATEDYLRSLLKPKRLAKRVTLEVGAAA